MGVPHNLVTPKDGEPIIAAIQDFITAAYAVSSKDRFFLRQASAHLCAHMTAAGQHIDLPVPAVLKPEALWTGKQVFDVLMRPSRSSAVLVNLEARCKAFKPSADTKATPEMDMDDNYLIIQSSTVLCGRMDKPTLGAGPHEVNFKPSRAVVDHEKHAVAVVMRAGDVYRKRSLDKKERKERISAPTPGRDSNPGNDLAENAGFLRRALPAIVVAGIQREEGSTHTVYVEGSGLRHCINTDGVHGRDATNFVMS